MFRELNILCLVGIAFLCETNLDFPLDFILEGYRFLSGGVSSEELGGHKLQGVGSGVWLSPQVQRALSDVRTWSGRLIEVKVRSITGDALFLGQHAMGTILKRKKCTLAPCS